MGMLYTHMKVFQYPEKLASLPPGTDAILPPIHIRIKPTNVCAHNCWYCAYRVDNLQLGQDMVERDSIPKEKMVEIIDDIVEMGVKAVTFSGGGDPFYYAHLLPTVKKLADTPVKFASLTNGAKLRGELADIFAHRATWLRISIDGWDPASYAKSRGVSENEFVKVVENMRAFKKLGGACYLGISFIVGQPNASHVFEFVKMMKDVGVNSVKVSPVIVSNNGVECAEYHRPVFSSVRAQVEKAMAELADKTFEIFDAYQELEQTFEKEYTWCPFLQILPVIGADLNVYACPDKAYNLENGVLGSIKNRRFKDFWFDSKEQFYKVNPSVHCNNHCIANKKNKMILEYLNVDKDHMWFV